MPYFLISLVYAGRHDKCNLRVPEHRCKFRRATPLPTMPLGGEPTIARKLATSRS